MGREVKSSSSLCFSVQTLMVKAGHQMAVDSMLIEGVDW